MVLLITACGGSNTGGNSNLTQATLATTLPAVESPPPSAAEIPPDPTPPPAAEVPTAITDPAVVADAPANTIYEYVDVFGNSAKSLDDQSAGTITNVVSTYDTETQVFTLKYDTTSLPDSAEFADGFWLVVSPGPSPWDLLENILAILYGDLESGTIHAEVYEGTSDPVGDYIEGFPQAITTVDNVNGTRTHSFTLNVGGINSYGSEPDWLGVQYGAEIGAWLQTFVGDITFDGTDVTELSMNIDSWYDFANRSTTLGVTPLTPIGPRPGTTSTGTRVNKVGSVEFLYISGAARWLRVNLKTDVYETTFGAPFNLVCDNPKSVLIPLNAENTVEETELDLVRKTIETARIGPFHSYFHIYKDTCADVDYGTSLERFPVARPRIDIVQARDDSDYTAFCPKEAWARGSRWIPPRPWQAGAPDPICVEHVPQEE